MNRAIIFVSISFLLAISFQPSVADSAAHGHTHHHHMTGFSAGEPGDPKKPARVVQVTMNEVDGKMRYVPDRIEVRKGELIKFVLRNSGTLDHEFVLASAEENDKHAELMMKNPEMEHDDPNGKRLAPAGSTELFWRFTKRGTFEFACLIPGHREAGMLGSVVVR